MVHEAKRNKAWEVWANEKCRECSHNRLIHVSSLPIMGEKATVTMAQCNYIMTGEGLCFCPEFAPPDNLEYIELLAKKKGIIPEDEDKI